MSLRTCHFAKSFLPFVICLLFVSCEKDSVLESTTSHIETTLISSLPTVSIDQIGFNFIEGIPSFENTEKFAQAVRSVSITPEAEYLHWAEEKGLRSAYHTYLEAAEKIESSPEIVARDLLTDDESRNVIFLPEGGIIPNPALIANKLTDDLGRIYIGNDIHSFTAGYHHLVDDGNAATLANALSYTESDVAKGIIVENLVEISFSKPNDVNPGDKVQVEQFACPSLLFSNLNGQQNTSVGPLDGWWSTYAGQVAIVREDEQRVGCSKKRCRQGTWSAYIATTLLTELQGSSFTSTSFINYAFNNRRRSGWNWIRTFPNVLIDDGVNNQSMDLATEIVQLNTSNNQSTFQDFVFPVVYPSEFMGTADESPVIAELSQQIPYDFPNAIVRGELWIDAGAVRHWWTNRGNNPASDPISVEYRCN